MANSVNKVIVLGNVGRDPEMRYTPGGQAVTSFSVAATYTPSRDSGREPETEWFNVVAWDKLAETVNNLVTKGRKVYVEGRQKTRHWEDQGGEKKSRTEVIATTVILVDPKPRDAEGGQAPAHAPRDLPAAEAGAGLDPEVLF